MMADKLCYNKAVDLVIVGAADSCYMHRAHFWPAWMDLEHVRKDFCLLVTVAQVQAVWSTRDSAQVSDWAGASPPEVALPTPVSAFRMCQVPVPISKPRWPCHLTGWGSGWGCLWGSVRSADQGAKAQTPEDSGRRITETQWQTTIAPPW